MSTTAPADAHKAGLARLFATGNFADCSIKCGSYEIQAHKAILSTQSDYFSTAFSKNAFKEGHENKITLLAHENTDTENGGDDPDIVKIMVEYFYKFDYSTPDDVFVFAAAPPTTSPDPFGPLHALGTSPPAPKIVLPPKRNNFGMPLPSPRRVPNCFSVPPERRPATFTTTPAYNGNANTHLLTHAKVFAIALKYQIPALRALAVAKFAAAIERGWNHDSLAEVITLVYTSTPDEVKELRSIIVETLLAHDTLLDKPEVESAVCDISTLAYQLLKRKR